MDIERNITQEHVELALAGRLDAAAATYLDDELSATLRNGGRRLRLQMAGVQYLSSAGIRVLVKYWKELQAIQGSFQVAAPSDFVREVLELSGMDALLATGEEPAPRQVAVAEEPIVDDALHLAVHALAPSASLICRLLGDPGHPEGAASPLLLAPSLLAVGVGAFGADDADCRRRFGEFLAVGGTAACLPTDGSDTPDYLTGQGAFVPTMQALYAACCEGNFSHVVRFEPREADGAVSLERLAELGCAAAGAQRIGMALIAETAGLVGAALRRSPAQQAAPDPFTFPEIRDRLAFTPEPAYPRALALAAGIAVRGNEGPASFLRPLGPASSLHGHFHAAAFSYRALPGEVPELAEMTASLCETQRLLGVLHLLHDGRAVSGAGGSMFIRGMLWVSPLQYCSEVTA